MVVLSEDGEDGVIVRCVRYHTTTREGVRAAVCTLAKFFTAGGRVKVSIYKKERSLIIYTSITIIYVYSIYN